MRKLKPYENKRSRWISRIMKKLVKENKRVGGGAQHKVFQSVPDTGQHPLLYFYQINYQTNDLFQMVPFS